MPKREWFGVMEFFLSLSLELTSLLSNRMEKVLEDYDPQTCKKLYSDDSGYALSSTRSDAVSNSTG